MPSTTITLLLAVVTMFLTGCGDGASVPPGTSDGAVAIGWARHAGDQLVPQVLRRAGGEWIEATLPEPILREYEIRQAGASTVRATFDLWRAGFTSATRAWILARGPGDQGGALLLSEDGGATWRDASDALPAGMRFGPSSASTPLAIWFQSETDWWIAGGRRLGPVTLGPVVWRSGDGGRGWELALDRAGPTSVTLLFSQLGARPALVLDAGTPDVCASRITLGGDGHVESLLSCRGEPRDLAEIGARGWLTVGTPAVYSWTGALPLVETPLPLDSGRAGGATRLDFADDRTGVACGATAPAPIVGVSTTPACWYSVDAGASWTASPLPSEPGWMSVADVALSTREHGWAIVDFGEDAELRPRSGLRFLRTDDGGRTWQAVDTAFDGGSRMTGLAVWRAATR